METAAPVSSSPPLSPQHPCFFLPSPSSATKGFGLKKWKRMKRHSSNIDPDLVGDIKVLKRDFSMSANPVKDSQPSSPHLIPPDSATSSNISVHNFHVDHSSMADDRHKSSRSSSATSALKSGFIIRGSGTELGKDVVKNSDLDFENKKPSSAQRGKEPIDSTKKHRGETIRIDRGSSHCSGESESGSNFIFLQTGTLPPTDDGIQTRYSANTGEESVDDSPQSDEQTKVDRHNGCENNYTAQSSGTLLNDFNDELCLEEETPISGDALTFSVHHLSTESLRLLKSTEKALKDEVNKLQEVTCSGRGIKQMEVQANITITTTTTTTTRVEERERQMFWLEVKEEGEEIEKLWRKKVEAELKYLIQLEAATDASSRLESLEKVGVKAGEEGGKKRRLFTRAVSCFFIQLTLLAALLLSKLMPPPTTSTSVLPT